MTERTKKMLDFFKDRSYRKKRYAEHLDITEKCIGKSFDEIELICLTEALNHETPRIYENDIFGFNTCFPKCPQYDRSIIKKGFTVHNVTINFDFVISQGFDAIIDTISEKKQTANSEQLRFYAILEKQIDLILCFCKQYRKEAQQSGNLILASALENIPHKGAVSLYEACLFQKIIIFALRSTAHNHITLGRFDQYMYKYYKHDVECGMSREELLEIIELYFISLNLDTDTYFGMQQGDNGQSMVLGGFDLEGNNMFNELSSICLDASIELEVIDPKINMRVGKNTPDELYEYGTKLTKKGLGFPQYCNDDIVIPALISLGYAPEDAENYTVAACWEFIVPNCSMDIPNIQTFNFPLIVNNAIHDNLEKAESFDALMTYVDKYIATEAERIIAKCYGKENFGLKGALNRSPLMSLFIDGCFDSGKDVSEFCAKYYNHGCHGAGISNATDALAAVKKVIFEKKTVSKKELLNALNQNFDGKTELRNKLLACPKVGNDDDYADDIMVQLMDSFSKSLNGKPNGCGGVWRAGTGSAMEYILSAKKCPATADGRYAEAPYASSFSPSVTTKLNGPLSVIKSFTKPDLKKTINGGPLTLEIHQNVFRNSDGEKKVAQLVKLFIVLGGHQLQLNAVNKERLIDAQKHPENYPNLIVRVWGWSGYFCELERCYQDHIISRTDLII